MRRRKEPGESLGRLRKGNWLVGGGCQGGSSVRDGGGGGGAGNDLK